MTMRIICWISIFVLATSAFAGGTQSKGSRTPASFPRVFTDAVGKYVQMEQDLDGSVSAQKPTAASEEIADRQHQLAGVIADARRGAQQGEFFTHEVAEQFRKIIQKAFKEPGGVAMRKTIQ